jgi:hypothetical protein
MLLSLLSSKQCGVIALLFKVAREQIFCTLARGRPQECLAINLLHKFLGSMPGIELLLQRSPRTQSHLSVYDGECMSQDDKLKSNSTALLARLMAL